MGASNTRKKGIFVGFSLIFGIALLVGMVLSGCAPTPATPTPATPTPATPAPKTVNVEGARVAYLLPNVGPWYNDKWFGFKDECLKLGMAEPVMYSAGGYANVAKQVSQVEDAIAAGFDGIVIHATSGSALIPPVEKALAAGIYVTTEHSPLAEKIVPHIWEAPAEAGRTLAMLLCNEMGGEGKIFMVNGPPGQMESLAEDEAFVYMVETWFPEVQIFGEWPVCDVAAALKVVEDLLTAHPDVKGVYCWSGTYGVPGTVQALKAAGYSPGEVKIVASYCSLADYEPLREGWCQYLMSGAVVTVGRTSAQNMAAMFRGEEVPMEINVPMISIGQSAMDKWDTTGLMWEE